MRTDPPEDQAATRPDRTAESHAIAAGDQPIAIQRLTFEAYMNKKLVKARAMAHVRIGLKNLAHLTGVVGPDYVGRS